MARFPLSSMFEGIDRCPAGAYISQTNEIKVKNYLKKVFEDSIFDYDIKLSADLLEKDFISFLKHIKNSIKTSRYSCLEELILQYYLPFEKIWFGCNSLFHPLLRRK